MYFLNVTEAKLSVYSPVIVIQINIFLHLNVLYVRMYINTLDDNTCTH